MDEAPWDRRVVVSRVLMHFEDVHEGSCRASRCDEQQDGGRGRCAASAEALKLNHVGFRNDKDYIQSVSENGQHSLLKVLAHKAML
jgi:hypothetical protein